VDSVLNYIQVRAFGRGFSGHRAWIVVAVALWMLNRARHQDDVIYRTELKPGERLIVKTSSPSSSVSDR
jgi:hypothetical protein